MLFADLVGSTSLGEREDPEVVQDLVSSTFTRLSQEIERFGGTVDKIMGDAILALFGVPAAHEDDPERAVRAALEMQSVLTTHERRGGRAPAGRSSGCGSASRPARCMVNLERTPDLPDRMVTGDAANTASRLQSAAEPGHRRRGARRLRRVQPGDRLPGAAAAAPQGQGRGDPGLGRRRRQDPPRRTRRLGLEAALVGRDDELATLKQAFHRVVSTGRPALVTVIGPAGVGKSRIAWELLEVRRRSAGPAHWIRGRCFAYGNRSYSALAEAMKARLGVREDESPDAIRAKVDVDGGRAVRRRRRGRPTSSDGARRRHAPNGRSCARTCSRRGGGSSERDAARRPVVLLLEDIHWADEGLLDFLDHLADWGQGPILVAHARPPGAVGASARGGAAGMRNYSSAVPRPALAGRRTPRCSTRLLGAEAPEGLRRLVLERSEGNPLFTEEIVRSLIDRGVLRAQHADIWELAASIEDIELPRSVQGVIASRLDGLPADEKRALQDGAVVGRLFWLGVARRT